MALSRRLLSEAAEKGIIREDQVEPLWAFFTAQAEQSPSFRVTHILYYFGGLIAIGAMSLFMTMGWELLGAWGLVLITLAYAIAGLWLTEFFLYRKQLAIPAGVTATFVVVLTPLAVYGLQSALGFWAEGRLYRDYHIYIDWRWLLMELATLASAAVLLWRYRLPFLMMPVAVTLWYISMDLTPFLFQDSDLKWELRQLVSLWVGVLITLLAFWVDIRSRHSQDYAFWLYLFGVLTFWLSMSMMNSDSEWSKFSYFCINLAMIAIAAILSRRIFAVLGGLGVAGYLGYLANHIFQDSLLFPFVLSAIGFGIIYLGILWQRHEAAIAQRLKALLPQALQELLDR